MNFYFPRRWSWLWGWQRHATYIGFHVGRIDVLVSWRP